MSKGEKITVCDMHSSEFLCEIYAFENGEVILKILNRETGRTEPPYRVTLFQALPKGDKMDSIVQKSVETGVYAIVPFISERCVSRPDSKSEKNKLERWNRISLEAAKQCGRGIVPEVRSVCRFDDAVRQAAKFSLPILLYEGSRMISLKAVLENAADCTEISIIVGCEGGFSAAEAEKAVGAGIYAAGLGPRILRCETAPAAALSAISYALELR